LGGEERVMTAFFSDIASFSTISECLTASELVRFINEYLSEMCDIIENYGGTIDKFEGDAIVAFFGAPIRYEDHAVRGCMACIDQQHGLVALRQRWQADQTLPQRLQDLRVRWEKQGRLFAKVRMGLTCGPMVVGNMGSRRRTDYTMMGDVVNLAARFESGQKIYGTNIMVNDQVYEQVKDLVEYRRLDLIQVMGKEEPVTAYEVLDRKGQLSPQQYEVVGLYNQGLERYDQFDFAGARKLFDQALTIDPQDGPSLLYADRCEEFAADPPKDLVYRAQSK
jgi:adenylate cyclase